MLPTPVDLVKLQVHQTGPGTLLKLRSGHSTCHGPRNFSGCHSAEKRPFLILAGHSGIDSPWRRSGDLEGSGAPVTQTRHFTTRRNLLQPKRVSDNLQMSDHPGTIWPVVGIIAGFRRSFRTESAEGHSKPSIAETTVPIKNPLIEDFLRRVRANSPPLRQGSRLAGPGWAGPP